MNNQTLKIAPFENYAEDYDNWFQKYPYVFESEVAALRDVLPLGDSRGLEIGLGTGRFSQALGLKEGIEPSLAMRKMALSRGIDVMDAVAEKLPFKDLRFDFVLIVSSISYFNDIHMAFQEARRVLKPGGSIIIGFIEKNSIIGKYYENKRHESIFYKQANYYTVAKLTSALTSAGFINLKYSQTLFKNLDEIKTFEPAELGFGKGSFVVIKATKK